MGFLTSIQAEAYNRLVADVWFENIPLITEKLGDIPTLINIGVGKIGTCAVITTPQFDDTQSGHDIPVGKSRLMVSVFESVIINQAAAGTKKAALDTAECALALLKGYKIVSGDNCFYAVTPTIELVEASDVLWYNVHLEIIGGYKYEPVASKLKSEDNIKILTEAGAPIIIG